MGFEECSFRAVITTPDAAAAAVSGTNKAVSEYMGCSLALLASLACKWFLLINFGCMGADHDLGRC